MDSIMDSRFNWPFALLLSSLMSRDLYNLMLATITGVYDVVRDSQRHIARFRSMLRSQACWYSIWPSRSRASNSLSDRSILTAATFSSRCATFDVPGIGSMTGLRLSTHASAIWLGVAPWDAAMASRIEPLSARRPAASGNQDRKSTRLN